MATAQIKKCAQLSLLASLLATLVLISLPQGARSLTVPGTFQPVRGLGKVAKLARVELRKKPRENRGNNVPRYHRGRGRIAPYSVGDQWCVAFATWVWDQAGFDAYQATRILWPSADDTMVAVQVRDLSRWAQRYGTWALRAQPGFLVVYGRGHIGVVTKVNREGRAIRSIEGNKGDRVAKVLVPFDQVTGYISPIRLSADQRVSRRSLRADIG